MGSEWVVGMLISFMYTHAHTMNLDVAMIAVSWGRALDTMTGTVSLRHCHRTSCAVLSLLYGRKISNRDKDRHHSPLLDWLHTHSKYDIFAQPLTDPSVHSRCHTFPSCTIPYHVSFIPMGWKSDDTASCHLFFVQQQDLFLPGSPKVVALATALAPDE